MYMNIYIPGFFPDSTEIEHFNPHEQREKGDNCRRKLERSFGTWKANGGVETEWAGGGKFQPWDTQRDTPEQSRQVPLERDPESRGNRPVKQDRGKRQAAGCTKIGRKSREQSGEHNQRFQRNFQLKRDQSQRGGGVNRKETCKKQRQRRKQAKKTIIVSSKS